MKGNKPISGFSGFSKSQKIDWLINELGLDPQSNDFLQGFELDEVDLQGIISDFSENQVSNYHLPFSVAPNFLVNGEMNIFPLVTEESSVVAALAKAAGFWSKRGGFHAEILGTEKKGQVHFCWSGNPAKLLERFPNIQKKLLDEASDITKNMQKRGGGVSSIELKYLPEILPDYYQLDVSFDTQDAMGANFINSCLEQFGKSLQKFVIENDKFNGSEKDVEIIMSILSNYVPDCRVKAWVECPVAELMENEEDGGEFAEKFVRAIHIAKNIVSRAVTHNKGIFNGIDALAIATGNDFRAIEAAGHAFAVKDGEYCGLTDAKIIGDRFRFSIELSFSVGVVGGVTALHPMAKLAMQILRNPSAKELMGYLAVAGLASNWSAVKALVTTGIQHGHMKMHLSNVLNTLNATENQKIAAKEYFQDRSVSFSEVEKFLNENE